MRRSVFVAATMALACAFPVAACYRSAQQVEERPPAASAPAPSPPGPAVPPATVGAEGERPAAAQAPSLSEGVPTTPGPAAEPDGPASPAISGVPQGEETPRIPSSEAPSTGADSARKPPEGSGIGTARIPPESPGRADAEQRTDREETTLPENAPSFAREKEKLVYRVEFLGLTMGYAQFRFRGTVRIDGKVAYHLTVRAWTSDLLAVFYPMNDTIEYYLDVETLAPIRQEFASSRKEDDIAYYDQKAGKIVYRYKKDGKVRKQVEVVPGVYDPVSVVYYFRTREVVREEAPRPMYAGRKLWEVSAKPVGEETIRTGGGQVDTVMIEPVLRKGGKQEHKGNLRVWMTRDERHVPVRLYAKFKKVRTWTLVGELVPDRQGG